MNRLLIRADADHVRGTGHVLRTLALAQEWRRRGEDFLYVGRVQSKTLEKRIEKLAVHRAGPRKVADVRRRCRSAWRRLPEDP